MNLSRRELLQAGLAAGGLMILRPTGALAASLPSIDNYGTPRASRLVPNSWLVHADMHNHSQFSDGDGDPFDFYASTRASGLDAAALTDHATLSDGLPESPCTVFAAQADAHAGCNSLAGLHEGTWQRTRELADTHDAPGTFAAVRGFEWSSPTLGHMNVWFSEEFTDPLHTGGLGTPDDLARFAETEGFPFSGEAADALQAILAATPAAGLGMRAWFEWLKSAPTTAVLGGGADGIFGFNHPGREPGRFSDFAFDAALVDRCVSLELFNKNEDYFFELTDVGRPSPLIACLDAGWKPGLLGVSDYHGTDWGFPEDRGRAGMWVDRLDRGGLREAMEARRFFATNLKGLRLDATANGARMGSTLGHTQGVVSFALDLDRGPAWYGRELHVQVLQTGSVVPTIVEDVTVRVPRPDQPVITFDVPIDVEAGRWVVLRVTDPAVAADGRATSEYAGLGGTIAYTSPFYLDPDVAPPPASAVPPGAVDPTPLPGSSPTPAPAAPTLPVTGGGLGGLAGLAAIAGAGLLGLRRRGHDHDHDHERHHDHHHDHRPARRPAHGDGDVSRR